MHIGLAFDAVADWQAEALDAEDLAEFDVDETITAIEQFWQSRGHTVERIGRLSALIGRLQQRARWDLVFNICEGLHGMGRESAVPALLDAYRIPYVFSDPLVLALSLHKAVAKRVVRDAGVPTAPFVVVEHPLQARTTAIGWPVFAKPVAEGTGKGIGEYSLCRSPAELYRVVRMLLKRFDQPVLVELWLPGREFTVGIVDGGAAAEAIGVMEIVSPDTYGFKTKKHYERVTYRLASDATAIAAGDVALAAWRALGGRDGGRVDVKCDATGQPMFLEANPLPGLHPVDSDLVLMTRLAGHSYDWLLDRICAGACARLGVAWALAA
jgi:D-alanine-D-alanine ligase